MYSIFLLQFPFKNFFLFMLITNTTIVLTKFPCCVWVEDLNAIVGNSFLKYFNHFSTFSLGTKSKIKISRCNIKGNQTWLHYTLGLPDPGLPECRINRPKAMSPAYLVVSPDVRSLCPHHAVPFNKQVTNTTDPPPFTNYIHTRIDQTPQTLPNDH